MSPFSWPDRTPDMKIYLYVTLGFLATDAIMIVMAIVSR